MIAADHGFATIEYEMNIRPYFAEAGLENKVRFFDDHWTAYIRLMPEFDRSADTPKLERVLGQLAKNPRVLRIHRSAEFPGVLKIPRFEDSDRVRGEIVIVPDFDTALVWTNDNDRSRRKSAVPVHSHGYPPFRSEMDAMLVFSGAGIRKGVKIGHVHDVDIAPTISEILGLAKLDFDGNVLAGALDR